MFLALVVLVSSTLASVFSFESRARWTRGPGGRGWEAAAPAAAGNVTSPRLFMGIMTREGWDGYVRREAMRESGAVPVTMEEVRRWEREAGIVFRFVIGGPARGSRGFGGMRTGDDTITSRMVPEDIISREELKYGDGIFLKLNEFLASSDSGRPTSHAEELTDDYKSLPLKTYSFFKAVTIMYPEVKFIAKLDDDVLVKPFNLLAATQTYEDRQYDYISCMKHGTVFTKPNQKWHEPQSGLLGKEYFLHAWGPAYVLSGSIARTIAAVPAELLRAFANEDVSVGAWMLAFNAKHFDDR